MNSPDCIISASCHVLIFKTNIRFKKDLEVIRKIMSKNPSVIRWTVDRDDHDKILRIESKNSEIPDILSRIREAGFHCEELPD